MLRSTDRPTAIFAASDTQALGVLAAAHEAGLNVPDDLSVIGYDDIEAADYVGLTTIRQQLVESGRRGAELVLAEMALRSDPAPVDQPATRARRPLDHGAAAARVGDEPGPICPVPIRNHSHHNNKEEMSCSAKQAGRRFGTCSARFAGVVAIVAAVGMGTGTSASSPPDSAADAAAPDCGTEPVELRAYFETGFDLPFELADEFTQQFPNVTWDISQDQFTNLMNATPAAAVGRQPARSDPVAVDGVARQRRAADEPRRLRHAVRLGSSGPPPSWRRTVSPRTARAVAGRCTRWASTTA